MSKRLGGIIGCKNKTSSWHLIGLPDGSNIGSTVQYNVGEKPTVILYTYINRHAGTPSKTKAKYMSLDYSSICYVEGNLKVWLKIVQQLFQRYVLMGQARPRDPDSPNCVLVFVYPHGDKCKCTV